jgi:hypothetical protein
MAINAPPDQVRGRPDSPKKLGPPAKPTYAYLENLRRDGKVLYAKQDTQIRLMREARELLHPTELDPDWKIVDVEVRASILTDNIQRTVSTLGVNEANLQCKPSAKTDEAQDNATLRERTTMAILEQAGRRDSGPPTYWMAIDAAAADGGAWTKFNCIWDNWAEVYAMTRDDKDEAGKYLYEDDPDPEQKKGEEVATYRRRLMNKQTKDTKYQAARSQKKLRSGVPFKWSPADVAAVYPFFREGRLREVLEVTKVPTSQTFRDYRLKKGRDGTILKRGQADRSPTDYSVPPRAMVADEMAERMSEDEADKLEAGSTVEFWEHWDDYTVTYVVVGAKNDGNLTGQVVDQWEHGYGRHCYFFAPGIWMNHWRNRKVGWGVSQSMLWLCKYLDYLLTVHANLAARDAFSPLQREVPQAAAPLVGLNKRPNEKAAEPPKWQLGRIYDNQPGGKISPILWAQTAEGIKEQIKIVMDLIDALLTPRVQSQIGGNLEGAGFAISQILAEGRIRHDPTAKGIERMLTEITEFMWHLIRTKVKEPVSVYSDTGATTSWEELGPKDLERAVKIVWTVNAETPSAELLRARYWHERLTNQTASWDQAVEGMGDNPDEVRLGRVFDRIRNHDSYKAWQEQMVFAEAERGDILADVEESIAGQMAATGAVPPMNQDPNANPANVPDIGALALGGGTSPIPGPLGAAAGVGPGATMPTNGAQAQVQSYGPPGT